jgi:hypothetical protein
VPTTTSNHPSNSAEVPRVNQVNHQLFTGENIGKLMLAVP